MRFFVLGNARKTGVREEAERLLPRLKAVGEIVVFDFEQNAALGCVTADIALVYGGDGAILRAARQMGYCQVPVLGINLGKLGFLADLSPEDVNRCLPLIESGNYRTTSHLMFECVVDHAGGTETYLGLNEAVVHTGPPFHM